MTVTMTYRRITMSANETYKVIPIKVTAQDGTVSNHSLTIYRQSEATTIKEIKVEIVDASGNVLNIIYAVPEESE